MGQSDRTVGIRDRRESLESILLRTKRHAVCIDVTSSYLLSRGSHGSSLRPSDISASHPLRHPLSARPHLSILAAALTLATTFRVIRPVAGLLPFRPSGTAAPSVMPAGQPTSVQDAVDRWVRQELVYPPVIAHAGARNGYNFIAQLHLFPPRQSCLSIPTTLRSPSADP